MADPTPRLVVGDDGSAAADVVWLWVNEHPWPGWRISVVTAQRPSEWTALPVERTHLHPWTPPHPRELLARPSGVELEHLVAEADPRIVLDSLPDATLLAVGPHGAGRLGLRLGSTAQWLLHRPTTPLVLVRAGHPTRRVVVCTDGSAHARRAVAAFAALPWAASCDVRVVGVRTGRDEAERGVAEATELLATAGIPTSAEVIELDQVPAGRGDVRDLLLRGIADAEADLAVLGTAGIGGWRRAVLGSTASAVVDRARCSVLVAHDAEAST